VTSCGRTDELRDAASRRPLRSRLARICLLGGRGIVCDDEFVVVAHLCCTQDDWFSGTVVKFAPKVRVQVYKAPGVTHVEPGTATRFNPETVMSLCKGLDTAREGTRARDRSPCYPIRRR